MTKSKTATALRTPKTWKKYQAEPKKDNGDCFMCDSDHIVIVKEWKHWLLIENNYPYDVVAKTHHLLIPRRHVGFKDQPEIEEFEELEMIFDQFETEEFYDCTMQNFTAGQSQPQHLHYHLLEWKRIEV